MSLYNLQEGCNKPSNFEDALLQNADATHKNGLGNGGGGSLGVRLS
jgi:hypothetical protein